MHTGPEHSVERATEYSATARLLRNADPAVWDALAVLDVEQRDAEWLALTQRHLRDASAADRSTTFATDEQRLLDLNYLGAMDLPRLDAGMAQRGFAVSGSQPHEHFGTYGSFVARLAQTCALDSDRKDRPRNVLISGIGASGKATIRNVLTRTLIEQFPEQRILPIDRDYEKNFPPALAADLYLVEDVHGLDATRDEAGRLQHFDGTEGVVGGYDAVVYVLAPAATRRENLIRRGLSWIRTGKLDLTTPEHAYTGDTRTRIGETAAKLEQMSETGRTWFREQLRVLRTLQQRGIPVLVVDPTTILAVLHGHPDEPAPSNHPFLEILERELLQRSDER